MQFRWQACWGAVVLAVAAPGGVRAEGLNCGDDAKIAPCVKLRDDHEVVPCANPDSTELGRLFREIADRVEGLEAQVGYATQTAERACAQSGARRAVSALTSGTAPIAPEYGMAVPRGEAVRLTSMVDAEMRLAEMNGKIEALEAREAEILGNIESSLAAAETSRREMVEDLQTRTLQLKEMWIRQQGQVDLVAALDGMNDTLLSMDLPSLMGGLVDFAQNFDQIADGRLRPLLEEWSAQTEEMHLGAGLIDAGHQLQGVTLGDLLLDLADQMEGMPMPAELAQGIQLAQSFGVQNFLPMLKNNLKGVSLGSFFVPLGAELDGVTPAADFYDLADELPGRILPSLAIGIGDAVDGLDLSSCCRVLSEELEPVDARILLLGVDKLLRGEPPSVILATMGEKLVGVDLGELLVRLGESMEEVSVSNVMFRMSEELGDVTVADALAEMQEGLDMAGVPVDLTEFLCYSGEHLARADMPRRMEGFQGVVNQLAGYTDEVRQELGLYPHGEPDFWVENPAVAQTAAASSAAASQIRAELPSVEFEVVGKQPIEDFLERIGAREEVVSREGVVTPKPPRDDYQRTLRALDDLKAAGLTERHPTVKKLEARLKEISEDKVRRTLRSLEDLKAAGMTDQHPSVRKLERRIQQLSADTVGVGGG